MPQVPPAFAGVPNVGCPLPDVLTAGQPAEAHFQEFAQAGYRTIVDVRRPEEPHGLDEPAVARALGLEYVNIPVATPYVPDEAFDRMREILRDPSRRPIVVHCGSANRVGALLLPYLILDEGKSREEAWEIALRVGLRSPELAQAAFAYVARAGG